MKTWVIAGICVVALALGGCTAATTGSGMGNTTADDGKPQQNSTGAPATKHGTPEAGIQPTGGISPTGLDTCGHEIIDTNHQGYDVASRDCLWNAYSDGVSATFSTTAHTVEGDPITYTVRVIATNLIEVDLDATKDRFGNQNVTKYTCRVMDRHLMPAGKIRGAIERRVLTFRDCTGGDSAEVHIPW